MKERSERDVVIIGVGPAGYVAAIHASHLGANVALYENLGRGMGFISVVSGPLVRSSFGAAEMYRLAI